MSVTRPAINPGGASARELIKTNSAAHTACEIAIATLEKASPQVGDYYLKGMLQYDFALREHKDRLERLRSVRDELKTLMDYVR